jgi:hypothetical protein
MARISTVTRIFEEQQLIGWFGRKPQTTTPLLQFSRANSTKCQDSMESADSTRSLKFTWYERVPCDALGKASEVRAVQKNAPILLQYTPVLRRKPEGVVSLAATTGITHGRRD